MSEKPEEKKEKKEELKVILRPKTTSSYKAVNLAKKKNKDE